MKMILTEKAKRLTVAVGVACAALGACAWDVEHDEIAQLTGEFLPREVKDFFDFDDFAILLANCHAPDMIGWPMADGTRRYATLDEVAAHVGAAEADVLKGLGFDCAQWFHSPKAKGALVGLLARAFGRGDPRTAAYYLSVMTHTYADESALNHPPILQVVQYSNFPGVVYPSRKVDPGAKNVFGFRSDDFVVHRARQLLRDFTPKAPDGPFDAVVLDFVADTARQSDVAAQKEGLIAFAPRPAAQEALAELIAMQIRTLVTMAWTAWVRRDPAAPLPGDDFDAAFMAAFDRIVPTIDPSRQFVFDGLFDLSRNPPNPKGTVVLVCEAYAAPTLSALSYVGRLLGASAARTLRDHGWAVKPISFYDIRRPGALPDPKSDVRLLLVAGVSGRPYNGSFRGPPPDIAARLRTWREAGGRLVYVAGDDPFDITGFGDVLDLRDNREVPASEAWADDQGGDWTKMSVTWGGQTRPQRRNANINGFAKPVCRYAVKEAPGVVPLARFHGGGRDFCVAARRGRVTWLPAYLLMPFVFSDDTTADWAALRLDSFAAPFFLSALEGS